MKIKKGCSLGCFSVLLGLFIIMVVLFQYRHFYTVGSTTFTFWKTAEGCYITPYKYWGLTKPKKEYIRASNVGGIVIVVAKDSLYLFSILTYERNADEIELNLSSHPYIYFPENRDSLRLSQDRVDYYKSLDYPYIDVYIKEMKVEIKNNH